MEEEYDFPDSTEQLSSFELGNLRLKLSRLHGYATRLSAQLDNVLSPLQEVFEIKRDRIVGELSKSWGGRLPSVDVLRAVAIDGNKQLAELQQQILELKTKKRRIDAQISIYERHLNDLSREQARQSELARNFQ